MCPSFSEGPAHVFAASVQNRLPASRNDHPSTAGEGGRRLIEFVEARFRLNGLRDRIRSAPNRCTGRERGSP
ncbi:MAG: hypothetical protein QOH87_4027 [Trebonia sp.]|jgi:hypothetical protein|nr:hypothetical protein [Trebonia sp.]